MQKGGLMFGKIGGKSSLDKKGLSEVVTTLLFVLLALGAVLLVWFVVRNIISKAGEDVDISSIAIASSIKSVEIDEVSRQVQLIIQRDAGEGEVVGFAIIIEDESGQSTTIKNYTPIAIFEAKKMSVDYSASQIGKAKKISAVPIVKLSSGKEALGYPTLKYNIEKAKKLESSEGLIAEERCDLSQTPEFYALFDARDSETIFDDDSDGFVDLWTNVYVEEIPEYVGMTHSSSGGVKGVKYIQNGLNNLPEIQFGSDETGFEVLQSMLRGDDTWFPTTGNSWTMISVLELDSSVPLAGVVFDGNPLGGTSSWFKVWDNYGNGYMISIKLAGQSVDSRDFSVQNGAHILVIQYDGINLKAWIDGGSSKVSWPIGNPVGTSKKMNIGIIKDVSTANFDLSMMMISHKSLTASELDSALDCVSKTWGIGVSPVAG